MVLPRFILIFSCPDKPGIVSTVTALLFNVGANIEESHQFSSCSNFGNKQQDRFFMRVEFTAAHTLQQLNQWISPVADEFSFTWQLHDAEEKTRAIIMVSTEGHCLNDLLFRQHSQRSGVDFVAVASNHQKLAPLAEFYGIPFHHIPIGPDTKSIAENQLRSLIRRYNAKLTILARYMQILSDSLCQELSGKAINIHHSFLPSFKGAKPYNQAFDRGVKLIGATSHYITVDLDEGPIIEQEVIRVNHTHTPGKLVELGRDVEARTLSEAVRLHAERRIIIDGNRTVVFK